MRQRKEQAALESRGLKSERKGSVDADTQTGL